MGGPKSYRVKDITPGQSNGGEYCIRIDVENEKIILLDKPAYEKRTHFALCEIPAFYLTETLFGFDFDKKKYCFGTVQGNELKAEINALTDNGSKIIAVVATHPFHTLAFPDFYQAYPDPIYIGTPRHIKQIKTIPWSELDVTREEIQKRWAPDIEMRIPSGAEFRAPMPEASNHFSSVWVYHKESATVHIDDTVMYFENPSGLLKFAKKHNTMEFHVSLPGPGLYPAPDAPSQFKQWVQGILADWEFDNMVCAHTGVKIGGAKEALRQTLEKAEPIFEKLEKKHKDNTPLGESEGGDENEPKDCANYNVDGNECG